MKRLVIPDIHGCARTFEKLLDSVGPSKHDKLYFLGDFIDKGPDSSGVLDTLLRLIDQGFEINAVRGNHEENMLLAYETYAEKTFLDFVKKTNAAADLLVSRVSFLCL